MKKQKFKHQVRTGLNPERSILPSLTEPEQVTPLELILNHRSRGIPVPIFNGVFSDQDTPDLMKMDFIEIAQLKETTLEGITQAKEDLHALTKRYEELIKPLPTKKEVEGDEGPEPPLEQ